MIPNCLHRRDQRQTESSRDSTSSGELSTLQSQEEPPVMTQLNITKYNQRINDLECCGKYIDLMRKINAKLFNVFQNKK